MHPLRNKIISMTTVSMSSSLRTRMLASILEFEDIASDELNREKFTVDISGASDTLYLQKRSRGKTGPSVTH